MFPETRKNFIGETESIPQIRTVRENLAIAQSMLALEQYFDAVGVGAIDEEKIKSILEGVPALARDAFVRTLKMYRVLLYSAQQCDVVMKTYFPTRTPQAEHPML